MEGGPPWGSGWVVEPEKGEEGSQDRGRAKLELSFFSPRRSRLSLEKEGNCKSGVFKGHVKIMETSS